MKNKKRVRKARKRGGRKWKPPYIYF
jgi:hypothetical protein